MTDVEGPGHFDTDPLNGNAHQRVCRAVGINTSSHTSSY